MADFDKQAQLEALIKRFPDIPCDIRGVILDYVGMNRLRLDQVFDLNPKIYREFFLVPEQTQTARALLASNIHSTADRDKLLAKCRGIYPRCVDLAPSSVSAPEVTNQLTSSTTTTLQEIAGHDVSAIIWQLSDIHFGKFNRVEPIPHELASLLGRIVAYQPQFRPDLIIVSGDVSSIAEESEFEAFSQFAQELSDQLWQERRPQRFLVIPGNHDTSWDLDGKADRMAKFKKIAAKDTSFITPFGEPTQTFEEGKISVQRETRDEHRTPPVLRCNYDDFQLELLLLISGYYTGHVPENVLKLMHADDFSRKSLLNLLRDDNGDISHETINQIARLPDTTFTRIAVTHHNLTPFGEISCQVKHAQQVMEALWTRNFDVVLHGHVHLVEDADPVRPPIPGYAFPVPCPTLASVPSFGNNGFAVHLLGPNSKSRLLTTLIWQISQSGDFRAEGITNRYQFSLMRRPYKATTTNTTR